ncbi:uncharacterized protein LOC143033704 [Oratosquilla oratoria]|uniref:uncharacterized protein LOC143033704 n=1 Tax=Oratosquilla oratoria TaxID=337810 RepID=UPI003F760AAE
MSAAACGQPEQELKNSTIALNDSQPPYIEGAKAQYNCIHPDGLPAFFDDSGYPSTVERTCYNHAWLPLENDLPRCIVKKSYHPGNPNDTIYSLQNSDTTCMMDFEDKPIKEAYAVYSCVNGRFTNGKDVINVTISNCRDNWDINLSSCEATIPTTTTTMPETTTTDYVTVSTTGTTETVTFTTETTETSTTTTTTSPTTTTPATTAPTTSTTTSTKTTSADVIDFQLEEPESLSRFNDMMIFSLSL